MVNKSTSIAYNIKMNQCASKSGRSIEVFMQIRKISYLGTISIFVIVLILAVSSAAIANVLLGLSIVETVLSSLMVIILMLIIHLTFMLSYKPEHDGETNIYMKIDTISSEIANLRKQQVYLRQHFDHEIKHMHGLNRTINDNINRLNETIKNNSSKLLEPIPEKITQKQQTPDIVLTKQPQNPDNDLLELLNQSLADNTVDLYAQPIVTLPTRHIAYYESYTWVRDGNGKVLTPREYIDVAERAGIMPIIDNLMLFKSVLLARRFVERNRDLKIFCNISGHSLLDITFFDQFIDFMNNNQEQADMLVFEFSQKTVNETGIIESESLLSLHQLGFRFSLDNVTDLNIDFRKLYALGFRYIKIDVNIFLNNAEAHGAQILVDDFAEHVRRSGLELIIEGVQNEHIVPELLDCNIKFAQGYLFGEPTLVRDKSHLLDEYKKTA